MASNPPFFLVNPVAREFQLGDRFNAPRNYYFAPHRKQLHEGVDIVSIDAQGRPVAVLAAQRGVVDHVGFAPEGYGNYVRIRHEWGDDTYVTWYGHLSEVHVSQGQNVRAGQKLGISGTTGFSTGIHLHLTLQHIGHGLDNYVVADVVDPEPFFELGEAPAFDEAGFVADVTIPDGTVMRAGQEFTKTWRIRNQGTKPWTSAYKLVFVSGEKMDASEVVDLPRAPVQSGEQLEVSVKLTAPSAPGEYTTTWHMRNADGDTFRYHMYAEIKVEETDAVNEIGYVADVTVEDGTMMQPGEQFVKTWRVRNTGTTTWDERYALHWISGHRMDGPNAVPLPGSVAPGEVIEISVTLTAPDTPGRHRSTWMLCDPDGKPFDFEQYGEIQVPQVAKPVTGLSEIRWIADVTIPDGTPLKPGEEFVKTWRMRNSGETTWGPGYELVFFGDEKMSGPDNVPLPVAKPGDVVEVSVPLVAPDSPGTHRSTWKARNPRGEIFEFDLFALIEVEDVQQPPSHLDEMDWVADVTIPDGTDLKPGERFVKTWRVRNTGTSTWGAGYVLAFAGNDQMQGPDSVALPQAKPGDIVEVSVTLVAPQTAGIHKSSWKGRNSQGEIFEFEMFALIDVVDPSQTFDMRDYLRGDGRVYDLHFTWGGSGWQRVQTQVEGNKFFHVKFSEWEELWFDDHFIYRGTDTSPGGGEVYQLSENGKHGSPWIPRHMTIGKLFQRTPKVVFRRKDNGDLIPSKQGIHVTWIRLEAVNSRHRFPSGIELKDVAVLAAYEDVGGSPKDHPFERYYYAKKYGLVAWEGEIGQSYIKGEFEIGTVPDNVREVLSWL